jgi:hypothetical protein
MREWEKPTLGTKTRMRYLREYVRERATREAARVVREPANPPKMLARLNGQHEPLAPDAQGDRRRKRPAQVEGALQHLGQLGRTTSTRAILWSVAERRAVHRRSRRHVRCR